MRSPVLLACIGFLPGCFGSSNAPVVHDAGPDDAGMTLPDASGDVANDAGEHPGSPDAGKPVASTAFGAGQVTSPQGIAIDPSTGVIWVASFSGALFKFDGNHGYLATFGTAAGAGKLAQGAGVALDSKGNVYVGDYGNHDVVEFDATGAYVATFPSADAGITLGRVTGVALDANDHLFAIDDDNSTVFEFDAAGGVSSQFSTSQAGQSALAGSVGMHFDAGGDLWIADYYYHSFAQYSPTGTLLAQYGASSPAAVPDGFSQPYGLTVDPSGNVWVTDNAYNDVQEFDSHGTFKALLGSSGAGAGQLQGPTGVAVDATGRVLVSDSGNDRIVVYEP